MILYAGSGLTGLVMMMAFFLLGTAATRWKKDRKSAVGSNAGHQTARNTSQVLANAGVAGLAALGNWLMRGQLHFLEVAVAGCFAAATADTLSSELGMVYGRRFFHVMTGRPDQKGLDGVVSVEGMVVGAAAACTMAGIFVTFQGWNGWIFIIISVAGIFGNWVDSVLGAAFERKGKLSNELVNFGCTLSGAVFAALFSGWAS